MAISIEELQPLQPFVYIGECKLVLSLVTLQKHAEFSNEFGSLEKALDSIREVPANLYIIAWTLLENKEQFNNSISEFSMFLQGVGQKESIVDISGKIFGAINSSVSRSMPNIKNPKRMKEIAELKNTDSDSDTEVCYATYFDTIAKRYSGYTLDKFMNLTLGQVHQMLNIIGDEGYKELEVKASLHGVKLKPRMTFKDISEEEEAQQEEDAMDALKRLTEKYEKNNKEE